MKQNLSVLSVSVGDMQVSPSSKVRDLGVVFDQYLTFHDHISGICRSTHFHLRSIGRIRNLLTFDATAQLIHALITTRLDLCKHILYNLLNNKIERLQRIQNHAAHMIKRSDILFKCKDPLESLTKLNMCISNNRLWMH